MKKLKSILGVFAIAALMALTSCQNAESPLVGEWGLTGVSYMGQDYDVQAFLKKFPLLDEFLEDYAAGTLVIAKNHTYTIKFTSIVEDAEPENGTWSYNGGTLTLKPDSGEGPVKFKYADGKLSAGERGATLYMTKK